MALVAQNLDASRFWLSVERLASPFFRVAHWQWVAFFVCTTVILRLTLALTHENYLGIDIGAYVLSALDVQGKDATNVGFPRPPLAPGWLLVPFIELFGIDSGYKVWTVLFSAAPILPVYLLTRDLVNRPAAVFAVAFFSVDMMQMEMMVTGALPQIGFTFIGLALWCIFRLTNRIGEWWHFGILASSVGILPYINQTAAGIAFIVLPVATIALFIFVEQEKGRMAAGPHQANIIFWVLPAAFIGGLIALGALPWYLANAPGNSELRFPGPILQIVNIGDTAWMQAALAVGLVYLLWKSTLDYRIRTLALLIGVLGFMLLWLSWDEAIINILYRSRYFIGLLFYPGAAYLINRYIFPLAHSVKQEWMIFFPMVAVWVALLVGQVVVFNLQAMLKDMAAPETIEALEIARQENPDKAIITNAYSLSHLVSALNQVESPNTWTLEPSPYYVDTAVNINCILGWVDGCSPEQAARQLNSKYVLIDERFPSKWEHNVWGSPQREAWETLGDAPWLELIYSSGSVKLWEITF